MVAVHRFVHAVIGAKHDPVLILDKEFAGATRLAAQFGFPCSELDHHIGKRVQQMRNIIEILRPVRHVQRDERRVRMLCEHAVACGQNRFFRGELWPIETPVRVLCQLFIPLIGVVHGVKECFGIGYVNGDRNAQAPAFLPDGIEARVIDRNQLPRFVAHA